MKRRNDGVDVVGRSPGFFLYPEDLERELKPLPIEAQAVWIRMFLQMHWAPRRGYLEHSSGVAFSTDDIARMIGIREKKLQKLLKEMEEKYGVFSRDENGVIFNRRMVRDTEISKKRKESGSKGGNPSLLGLDNQNSPDAENLVNQTSNLTPTKNDVPRAHATPTPIPLPIPPKGRETNTCASDDAREGDSSGFELIPTNAPPVSSSANGRLTQDQRIWFDQWWAIYWRRISRKDAEKAFRSKVLTLAIYQCVMDATRRQTPEMMHRDPDKRPYPATWLNAERWNDEPSAPRRPDLRAQHSSLADRTKALIAQRIANGERPI